MVNKKKLRWFGHLIGMDSNRKPSQVWETELSKRGEKEDHRMGWTYAKADEKNREDLAGGD